MPHPVEQPGWFLKAVACRHNTNWGLKAEAKVAYKGLSVGRTNGLGRRREGHGVSEAQLGKGPTCNEGTKYMAVINDEKGFQKCKWEP